MKKINLNCNIKELMTMFNLLTHVNKSGLYKKDTKTILDNLNILKNKILYVDNIDNNILFFLNFNLYMDLDLLIEILNLALKSKKNNFPKPIIKDILLKINKTYKKKEISKSISQKSVKISNLHK